MPSHRSLRRRAWEILDVAHQGDRASAVLDIGIRLLIALNIVAVMAVPTGTAVPDDQVNSVKRRMGVARLILRLSSSKSRRYSDPSSTGTPVAP